MADEPQNIGDIMEEHLHWVLANNPEMFPAQNEVETARSERLYSQQRRIVRALSSDKQEKYMTSRMITVKITTIKEHMDATTYEPIKAGIVAMIDATAGIGGNYTAPPKTEGRNQ